MVDGYSHVPLAELVTPNAIQDITFSYGANGNVTRIVDLSDTDARKSVSYVYDGLNRLTSASSTAASSTPFSISYTYDKLGNIMSASDGEAIRMPKPATRTPRGDLGRRHRVRLRQQWQRNERRKQRL